MIEFHQKLDTNSITAVLKNDQMVSLLPMQIFDYAVRTIGDKVVEKYGDEILKELTPESILEFSKEVIANRLAQKLTFKIEE